MRKTLVIIAALAATLGAWAQDSNEKWYDDLTVDMRVGLSIGGTMPLGMPASIRSLESYELKFNPLIGFDAVKPLDQKWGVLVGLRLARMGMGIDAKVKNYHMSIVRGGESLTGMFTGNNKTIESQWLLTLPLAATLQLHNVRLQAGPYVSYVTDRTFRGYAYDGYLRVDDPTGPKVELGSSETERGSYDFTDDMRRLQWGVQFGADWRFSQHWGVFGMVSWGLCGIHKASFHVIEQTLYPIYGTVGITYRLK